MSTDDSVSEDVSSLGALSPCHAGADDDGDDAGKESEASLLSSEGTSASGPPGSEDGRAASRTTGATVEDRPADGTPACNKIRSLCLTTDETFERGKSLPFINPSSLETLRALVQEIQSNGETDPEIWKDCEGRWLHLFQLVEKQYQEQILSQQEQYQCQIQLIQDEIKALVQFQNRQASNQPLLEFPLTPVTKSTRNTKDYILPPYSSDSTASKHVGRGNDGPAAPALSTSSSPSPLPQRPPTASHHQAELRPATTLSSGYGTLSAWGMGLEPAGSPGNDEDEAGGQGGERHRWTADVQEDAETAATGGQQDLYNQKAVGGEERDPCFHQQRTSGTAQPLTSWAQRQNLRAKRSKASTPEHQEQPSQQGAAEPSSSSFPMRRSDSLISEVSGLTYWRLTESELYRPLPDSVDSGAYLLLQEASLSPPPSQEPGFSLREIYQNRQRSDWDASVTVSPSSPQVLTPDPAANHRHSDHTSGFTSPSHLSSPSFAAQPKPYPGVGTPLTPDSMAECSPNPGDADCVSDASNTSASPFRMQSTWGKPTPAVRSTSYDKIHPRSHASRQPPGAGAPLASKEEEAASHTHSAAPRPCSAPGASRRPAASTRMERAPPAEDPVVLSLLRQNLREKHSRHVADLRAYYESEIQVLRDKLQLKPLPQDVEKTNQALVKRCKQLEKALAKATHRIQELQATNDMLEKKLAEWPERYAVAGAAVESLQRRLEAGKRSDEEKDATAARLRSRVRLLEESLQRACREADEREARREKEYKTLQELLVEYNCLVKEHEGLKNNLVSTENKLSDASDEISELKRVVSKLESQVKQLEHENQARARHASHSSRQASGAGLFHHPDLLLPPGKCVVEPDVTRRRSPCPPPDQVHSGRQSPFKLNPSSIKKAQNRSADRPSGAAGFADASPPAGSQRCASPPEGEPSVGQREAPRTLTPMMRALIEMEETRATESHAPWINNQRTKVGFAEQKLKQEIVEEVGPQMADGEAVIPGGGGGGGGGGGVARAKPGGAKSVGGAEAAAGWLRAQRSLSPEGHRSSSLPPPAQRNVPSTPTKRETLLMPQSAKSSPKRCPSENFSTAFGGLMPREEQANRFDGHVDQRRHSFHSSGSRKRLQFTSADRRVDLQQSSDRVKPPERDPQRGWGEERGADPRDSLLLDGLHSLAEAEKLLDELTQEKLQIEAALSRVPRLGGRASLQVRLDEVALENRLDRVNRKLGSIRMTLKSFHVLRSSANV